MGAAGIHDCRAGGSDLRLARSSLSAAVYVILVWIFAPISFGMVQFRIAEALTALPILIPEAIWGLFVGVMLSNILGGLGPWDIFGGSGVTLLAAWLTRRFRHSWLAYAWPILCNAFWSARIFTGFWYPIG